MGMMGEQKGEMKQQGMMDEAMMNDADDGEMPTDDGTYGRRNDDAGYDADDDEYDEYAGKDE